MDALKYYYREHVEGYRRVAQEGKRAWGEIHGDDEAFDAFPSRPFLDTALSRLHLDSPQPRALEYGCGTGPGACFLAERGFRVDAIDLIPAAIDIAKRIAAERGLDIGFAVHDVCELPTDGPRYDLIVDSYCLQGIVLEHDRERLFGAVRARLRPTGYYLVSSAVFDPARYSEDAVVVDDLSGRRYHAYGDDLFAADTDTVYRKLGAEKDGYEDAIRIAGAWWLPNRCHRTHEAIGEELQAAGFVILYGNGGHFVCARDDVGRSDMW
ncbi:class I SAM-dependent methyltransferase [Candidatus Poribacteria bacterium]|nr:class I SAM-dependent methyltransferase [Candidatus Poribacteria bacterium]